VCVHTIARTQPGQRPAYLAAVTESLTPLLAERGCTLMGAYSVPMRSTRSCCCGRRRIFATCVD
jgi:hypothetical protein